MARDRKRAKQRQRRKAAQQRDPRPTAVPRPGARDVLGQAAPQAEIAELAEASIQEPGSPTGPLEADEYPQPDELESADAIQEPEADEAAAPVAGRRKRETAGRELPREGNRFINFLRACIAELQRVQWPDRRQVGQATAVVVGFVIIAGSYLGLLDAVFSRLVNAIL